MAVFVDVVVSVVVGTVWWEDFPRRVEHFRFVDVAWTRPRSEIRARRRKDLRYMVSKYLL
jgi:hypothetical protein